MNAHQMEAPAAEVSTMESTRGTRTASTTRWNSFEKRAWNCAESERLLAQLKTISPAIFLLTSVVRSFSDSPRPSEPSQNSAMTRNR